MSRKVKPAAVKCDHVDRLYKAVANYVEKSGGKVAVIGGVQIIEWPNDLKLNFTVCIRCTGRKPAFKK